ncbi:MAG TPA: hypothetical protein VJL81_00150 [Solirubrobacterales bacterium]|nr:hypothetical protein [Solirubrobacterales bacterium]
MRFLLGAAIAIVALATASAQAARPFELGAQTLYNADGSGKLFANGSNTTWERCNPDLSVCEAAGTTREISTQGAPDGTVFKLQGNATGAVWHGNLSIVAPPSVQGVLSANELVTPVPTGWQGGWDGSFDQTQLAVCETPAGEDCTSISDRKYVGGCEGGGAVLDLSLVGRYLRIADRRMGPGTIETLDAYTSPFGHPIMPAEGDTAVAIVGQIGPATHERTATCGPKPLVEAWISSSGVAKVLCAFGCQATLAAGHAGRTVRATLQVPATGLPPLPGTSSAPEPSGSTLALSPAALKRLGGGRTRFAVEVGGQVFAGTSVKLPSPKHAKKHHKHKHRRGKR